MRGLVMVGAAGAVLALLPACTPTAGPGPSASPTPSVATPSETEVERQMRLDWEAAETAYRTAQAEFSHLAATGARKPSKKLRSVSEGEYLRGYTDLLAELERKHWTFEGVITIEGVRPDGGWTPTELRLRSCENNKTWKLRSERGDVIRAETPDYVQVLTARRSFGAWKIAAIESTKQVKRLNGDECKAA